MLQHLVVTPGKQPDTAALPLVVLMHGRGADNRDLADLAPLIDDGYRWVFPNAPKPFQPYPGMSFGYTWFDGWPPEGDSIVESRRLLLALLDDLVQRFPTPPGKVVLSGFSQGGLMALDVGYRTEQPLAGIITMSGALYEADQGDLDAHRDIPVLLVHGTSDDMIPVTAARRARAVLEEHGIEPEYHELPMGHHVTDASMKVVGDFLKRNLHGRPLA
ncbi:MAG TPA: alpha/beta hydrolase [Thermoanaerobaculia bacterium]|jgi:phospholipase/carboxylesterase|nr:alpha/beta hydrolase [Thermoanaerobaculia bacterium]